MFTFRKRLSYNLSLVRAGVETHVFTNNRGNYIITHHVITLEFSNGRHHSRQFCKTKVYHDIYCYSCTSPFHLAGYRFRCSYLE